MADIRPFRAVRPTPDKVAQVVSRSLHEYSKMELDRELCENTHSFLHIIHPTASVDRKVSRLRRFNTVRANYRHFLRDGIFIKETTPCYYLYRRTEEDFECECLLGAASVSEYRNNRIKRHEETLHRRELLFADYLQSVGFNAEPVLLAYPDNTSLSRVLKRCRDKTPEYRFNTDDGISHHLWVLSDLDFIESIRAHFMTVDALYIADGHHRTASSDLLAERSGLRNPDHSGDEAYNYFMACLVPESQIRISGFNRLIRGLNGLTKNEFFKRLEPHFVIEAKTTGWKGPKKKHTFGLYLDGGFYALHLRSESYDFTDALSKLDPQILYRTVLSPILGIHDLRHDRRIMYGPGKRNIGQMKREIDGGTFTLGFSMVPLTMDEIKAVSDAGLTMPPKSTYIEPKLRSGLTIYEF